MLSNTRLHLSVDQWLRNLDLAVYIPIFEKYHGVEDMLHLSEREFKTLGVHNGSHRARIASSLTVLKEKYHKALKNHSPNTSSLQVDKRSQGSVSPVHHGMKEPVGIRSWPSSSQSSSSSTRNSSHRSSLGYSIGIDASPEELKKALEWELSLDRTDLRSHGWYHGTILRQRAEELLQKEGDFIVRDCISQPGDFVITCQWNTIPLHFIIKKVICHPNTIYEKFQFCFEGDNFDSIHDFITYYVGGQCPLSSASGAILHNPINRSMPLSYYTSRYSVQCQVQYAALALKSMPPSEMEREAPHTRTTADSVFFRPKVIRVGSDPSLNPNAERRTFENRPNSGAFTTEAGKEMACLIANEKPPPKPSRVPSKKLASKPLVVRRERRFTPPTPFFDLSNTNEVESPGRINIKPMWSIPYKRTISGETRFSFLDHASVSSDGSMPDVDTFFTLPSLAKGSCFDPASFKSSLLSEENKPLESSVLSTVRQHLLEEDSKVLSSHLTRIDLEVAKSYKDEDLGLGVMSGMELILLPQGQQLVADLLERVHCLKIFVAVTILTCLTEEERISIFAKWIEVALDTKNLFGNLYGFSGIMLGLTIPQVANLHKTWLELRRQETDITFTFETKLKPTFKAMQEASFQTAPNTCLPYLFSLLTILRHHDCFVKNAKEKPCLDENYPEFELQTLEDHLESSRNILQEWSVFLTNTDRTLKNAKYVDELLDLFRTEFQLRMLWGRNGAVVDSGERHQKFAKVLEVLYRRYEQNSG